MPNVTRLRPEEAEDYLPPFFYLRFSQEEFPAFLANPTGTLKELGHDPGNLTVTVKDHVWDAGRREWITDQSDPRFATAGGLPQSSSWGWICGYQDEQCVCERVLM
ncbi:hypothetical protein JNUCC64_01880 [Streptomyces sp. JNUCC 64]